MWLPFLKQPNLKVIWNWKSALGSRCKLTGTRCDLGLILVHLRYKAPLGLGLPFHLQPHLARDRNALPCLSPPKEGPGQATPLPSKGIRGRASVGPGTQEDVAE